MTAKPKPDDLEVQVARAQEVERQEAEAEGRHERMIVTVEYDRSSIAYLRGHILDMLFERQDGVCFLCDEAMPDEYDGMHIHHEPPLCVRMPDGYGPGTETHQLRLTHPACNLGHKKPRRKRG